MTEHGQTLRTMVRVGLVGGTPYHRDLIREWLADVRCAGTVTSIVNGHRQTGRPPAAANGAGRTNPDVDLVVGIVDDPDGATLDSCRRLTQAGRTLPLVAILLTPGRQVLQASLDAGASGLVAATSGPTALADAITAVAGGAAWLDPALSHIAMAMARPGRDHGFGLTPTEQRVAAHFPAGLSNREIADRLDISTETVKTHISNIYRKLNVSDRPSAVTLLRGRLPLGAAADPGPGVVDTHSPPT